MFAPAWIVEDSEDMSEDNVYRPLFAVNCTATDASVEVGNLCDVHIQRVIETKSHSEVKTAHAHCSHTFV